MFVPIFENVCELQALRRRVPRTRPVWMNKRGKTTQVLRMNFGKEA